MWPFAAIRSILVSHRMAMNLQAKSKASGLCSAHTVGKTALVVLSRLRSSLGRVDNRDSEIRLVLIVLCTASLLSLLFEEQSWIAETCRTRSGS